jgi:hypothetical protein
MKKLFVVGKAVLLLSFVVFVSSCSTPNSKPKWITSYGPYSEDAVKYDTNPHFQDEASVNAVLQFSSWDYTFLVRPQYAEGGYLQQVRRDNIGKVFDRLHVQRGTAAVVVGWNYNGDVLAQLVKDWKTILNGCGFQRVVILRAQLGNDLNGSVIIDDSSKRIGSVQSPTRGS